MTLANLGRPALVLSLGAGVQSTTVALMSAAGELPRLDACIFADTGWEPGEVYQHLTWLEGRLAEAEIPVHRVSNGNIHTDALNPQHRFASMPLFVRRLNGSKGMIRRQCTSEYKIKPIERCLRELVGIKPRQRPRGILVEQWIGISLDEPERMSTSSFPWITKHYPLVFDVRMTRWDCEIWLHRHGVSAPRSACIGCPFHSDAEWRHIRDTDPDAWTEAVAFDQAIRSGNVARAGHQQLLGEAFLHAALVPLDEVDLSTPEERGQGALFVIRDQHPAECGISCGSAGVPAGFALLGDDGGDPS